MTPVPHAPHFFLHTPHINSVPDALATVQLRNGTDRKMALSVLRSQFDLTGSTQIQARVTFEKANKRSTL